MRKNTAKNKASKDMHVKCQNAKKNKQANKQTIMSTYMHTGWKMSKCNSEKTRIANLAITRSTKTATTQRKKARHQ